MRFILWMVKKDTSITWFMLFWMCFFFQNIHSVSCGEFIVKFFYIWNEFVFGTAGRIAYIVSSTLFAHKGHFIMAGAQSKQQTRCRQGKNTTPLSRSLQTWHISILMRLIYSSLSACLSVNGTSNDNLIF